MKEIEVESYNVPAEARSKNYRNSLTTVVGGGGAAIVPSAVVSGGAVDAAKVAQNLAVDSTDWQTIANNRQKAIDALKDLYLSKTTDDTAAGTIKFLKGLQIGDVKIAYDSTNGALALTRASDSTLLASLYATGGLTAYGAGSGMSGGGTSYDRLDKWSDYTTDKATYILSALLGNDLNTRVSKLENSTLTSVDWSIITNKPSVFAPAPHTHLWADITDAPTKLSQFTNDIHADIDGVSYGTLKIYPSAQITSSTSDDGAITPLGVNRYVSANYLPLSGGTMSGTALIQFADDGAWAKSNSGVTFPVKRGGLYWTGESDWVKLFTEETRSDNLDLIIQFGDDNSNRLQIRNASGSETAYITATGVFGGTFSGNASSASKVNNVLSWSGYSSGSFNGSSAKSISIPNNTNQLTNGAGFITSSASISGNAATATKLATARSIWGQSFNGTGNINNTIFLTNVGTGNYDEGIRILPHNSWSTLFLGGNDISASAGTSANSWCITNNNGNLYINRHGSNAHTGYELCNVSANWGFGTNSPSYKLDVNGTFHAGGAATLSSGLTVTGNILATGGVTAYTTSDRRLKKNIRSIDSLGVIRSLGGTYQFDYRKDNKHSIGFIAQNVRKSELSDIVGELDGYLRINYLDTRLISLALGASVELDDEVTRLRKKVSKLEKEVERLKAA